MDQASLCDLRIGIRPGDGWNIGPAGSLNVGSFGVKLSGNTMNMANNKTVGFSIATGATAWSIPGSYMCMGGLLFLTTQVTCEYSGVVREPTKGALYPSMNGVTLKLAGFNPTTGAITWTQPVKDVEAMTFGNGLQLRRWDAARGSSSQRQAGTAEYLDRNNSTPQGEHRSLVPEATDFQDPRSQGDRRRRPSSQRPGLLPVYPNGNAGLETSAELSKHCRDNHKWSLCVAISEWLADAHGWGPAVERVSLGAPKRRSRGALSRRYTCNP